MKPKSSPHHNPQPDLFLVELKSLVDRRHPLVLLADRMDWPKLEQAFEPLFCADNGAAACPVRLMVGLEYLKYTFDLGDEAVAEQWIENPYWQYFCGGKFFVHHFPVDPSSMSRWRRRLKEAGVEAMLAELVATGLRGGVIKASMFQRINVDTTVQEKFVRFPIAARLYNRMRETLVRMAKKSGMQLRQSYERVGRHTLMRQQRYASAQQFQRARRETKKLRTILGRVMREMQRQSDQRTGAGRELLERAHRLYTQQKTDAKKLYSVHAPEVECLAKGKVTKRYEFGCKAGVASTSKGNWIIGAKAWPGNPYDGHTLSVALEQIKRITGPVPKEAYVDMGYRGHGVSGETNINVVKRKLRDLPKSVRRWMNRRAAIEPKIGHLKSDHRMDRNRLKGILGDQLNVLLAACGSNLRKLLRAFFCRHWLDAFSRLFSPIPITIR